MKLLRPATEDEMVLAFLKAEDERVPASERGLIEKPNLEDESENARRRVFLRGRGYGLGMMLFKDFPVDVDWHRATLTVGEIGTTKYLGHREPTWYPFSRGTRLVSNGASNLGRLRLPPTNDPTPEILRIVAGVKQGQAFPELIFVGLPSAGPEEFVLLEGHKRATAYVYARRPPEVEVLVGFSPGMSGWYWF